MTESRGSGAASHRTDAWDQIDWEQAERTVLCLQAYREDDTTTPSYHPAL
jgi:citrate lyase beta subunit